VRRNDHKTLPPRPAHPVAAHRRRGSRREARTVADNLVLANLSGHDSHGVGMLPRYVDAVPEGGLKPNHRSR
jgi:LDH2 family malate/lactate/ureidoglycolate dehydrogenase